MAAKKCCLKSAKNSALAPLLLLLIMTAYLLLTGGAHAQQMTESEEAAETLLMEMKTEQMLVDSIDQMLQVQVQMNPALAGSLDEMKRILSDYINFEAIKPFYIEVYVDAFTTEKLLELANFYRTPVGQKSIVEMPTLFAKSAQFGMQIMQDNAAEIGRRMREAQEGNAATPEA